MRGDVRKNPRAGDSIIYFENGERKKIDVVSIDDRGILTYREDGIDRVTTLTVWRILAAKNWLASR